MKKISLVIVTHNSEQHVLPLIDSLRRQTRPADHVIVVDSASKDPSYLTAFDRLKNCEVFLRRENIGFCKGNNLGVAKVFDRSGYILFLNPDAFLKKNFLEKAEAFMDDPDHEKVGCVTGLLLGYDASTKKATGKIDSTGIFRKWYGRWYDRGQGELYQEDHALVKEELPAVCGALMYCRKEALRSILLRGEEVFDNEFYMWKEDIDLSLRLRKAGWSLFFSPELKAFHCRGWSKKRSNISRKMRLLASRNDLKLHWRYRSPHLIFSLLKYLMVGVFNF